MATLHLSLFYLTSISKQILIDYTCTFSHNFSMFSKIAFEFSLIQIYSECVCMRVFFILSVVFCSLGV